MRSDIVGMTGVNAPFSIAALAGHLMPIIALVWRRSRWRPIGRGRHRRHAMFTSYGRQQARAPGLSMTSKLREMPISECCRRPTSTRRYVFSQRGAEVARQGAAIDKYEGTRRPVVASRVCRRAPPISGRIHSSVSLIRHGVISGASMGDGISRRHYGHDACYRRRRSNAGWNAVPVNQNQRL